MRGLILRSVRLPAFLLGLAVLVLFAGNAGTAKPTPTPSASPSAIKDWPDVSVTLQNRGKVTETERKLTDCKSGADSLFREKRYVEAASQYEKCVEIDRADFRAHLFLGFSYYHLRRYDAATRALNRARELNPEDFEANVWLGVSQARNRSFKDAIPNLERARALKPDSDLARRELFIAYLAGGEFEKASPLYPQIMWTVGVVFLVIYCIWLGVILPFSLPVRDKAFPGFLLFLGWFGLLFEGQITFLFVIAALPWLRWHEAVLSGATLAALPIIVVGLTGFARQPWGGPFRLPPRFGNPKVILISLLLVLCVVFIGIGNAFLYTQLTGKPFPLQQIVPLIKNALKTNPAMAWLSVAVVIPFVEEILFRGLLFGAFEKHWGAKTAVWGSALVFVFVHLQIIGFVPLLFLGFILAWARLKTGSIALPIVLHGLNNAIAVAVLVFAPPSPAS